MDEKLKITVRVCLHSSEEIYPKKWIELTSTQEGILVEGKLVENMTNEGNARNPHLYVSEKECYEILEGKDGESNENIDMEDIWSLLCEYL